MIFKSLTLHNIFSYYDSYTFDLAPPTGCQRNIVIIMGRNGFGKTSLLNSVKLLFGGVTEELRISVQRGRMPSEKAYILGDGDWWGILNHRARNNHDFKCSVSAVLLNEKNEEIAIERAWDLSNDNYKNRLTVKSPRAAPLSDDEAQQYLSELLPSDYIPFFFFDAEEIGYLAEANRNQVIEKMELLLNIRPAENLKECLTELKKRVVNRYIAQNSKQQLTEAENKQALMQVKRSELEDQKQSIYSDIELIEDKLQEIQQKIKILTGQGIIENNVRLEATKKAELENLEKALTALSDAFERDAFLRLNAKQVEKTLPSIEYCANNQYGATSEMLQSLHEPLKSVFTTPPYPENRLSESQVTFYQQRITKLLDSRDIEIDDNKPLQLDSTRAKKLLTVLAAYALKHDPGTMLRDDLNRALRADQKISEIDKTLQDVRQLSDENKQQYDLLNEQQKQQQEELWILKDKQREVEHNLSVIKPKLTLLNEDIDKFRKQVNQSTQGKARVNFLEKIRKLLDDYKQQLKEQQRGVLEQKFNHHLSHLLDSNHLIATTKIDKFFQLQYLDVKGNSVAMSSISAGMKQLAATALLWALKDTCGKQLPVIIDTPLGRIDKRHQENLLTRYYPHAAKQVILLPTDSELDERKRDILAPYIYCEYELKNPDGESTTVERIPSKTELHHG